MSIDTCNYIEVHRGKLLGVGRPLTHHGSERVTWKKFC